MGSRNKEVRSERGNTDNRGGISWKRQREIFSPSEIEQRPVSIIGVGNIGSQAGLALARLGINEFHLYDHDTVEEHNLSSQSFFNQDLGKSKVQAMKDQILSVNPEAIVFTEQKECTGSEFEDGILIIATDSMKSRKEIAKGIKESGKTPCLVIDGRVGGPQLEVYTFEDSRETNTKTGEETDLWKRWESTFFEDPAPDPCGARYICYISMVIGSLIANQVKRYLKGEKTKKSILFNIDTLQLI